MKFPFKGRQRSGEFQLLKSDGITNYCIAHYIEVRSGRGHAQAIARLLHGPAKFQVELRHDSFDTLGAGIYLLVARHYGRPDDVTTIVQKAHRFIQSAIAEVPGAHARITGWERHQIEPERRRFPADDDDGEGDSRGGLHLPLRS